MTRNPCRWTDSVSESKPVVAQHGGSRQHGRVRHVIRWVRVVEQRAVTDGRHVIAGVYLADQFLGLCRIATCRADQRRAQIAVGESEQRRLRAHAGEPSIGVRPLRLRPVACGDIAVSTAHHPRG